MARIFVPGFGTVPDLYRPALGAGWTIHEPPSFASRAGFDAHVDSFLDRVRRQTSPVTVAGHSLGAAVAIVAATQQPEAFERLILIAPAGLPLAKPIGASLLDFAGQVRERLYPARPVVRAMLGVARAPRAALGLARAVHALDLRPQLATLAATGVDCEVVGCAGDTLTPPEHCRRLATFANAEYSEVRARGGHMWLIVEPLRFAALAAR